MKRIIALLIVFAMLVLLCTPAAAVPNSADVRTAVTEIPSEIPASAQEWEVLRITNAERMNAGVDPLTLLPALQNATDIRALELIESFSHTRPNGTDCFTAIDEVGLNYSAAGENIAAGYSTSAAVMEGWMNSSGHRANILNAAFKHIGVGYTYAQNDDYHNYWVQLFLTGRACSYSNFEILGSLDTVTSVDALGLAGRFTCGEGYCYMPLTSAMCVGDTTVNGTRTVTFSCFGLTASISVGGTLIGDADGNGTVNANDALLIMRYALGLITSINAEASDVDRNGIVNANDALLIMRYALGLISL